MSHLIALDVPCIHSVLPQTKLSITFQRRETRKEDFGELGHITRLLISSARASRSLSKVEPARITAQSDL